MCIQDYIVSVFSGGLGHGNPQLDLAALLDTREMRVFRFLKLTLEIGNPKSPFYVAQL